MRSTNNGIYNGRYQKESGDILLSFGKHELREEDEQALYKAYTEEEDIQNIVKSQAETASCDIERYGNTIYLIPQEENNFLGYSRVELKKELCKSTATNKDYYLAQFVILTLLTEFLMVMETAAEQESIFVPVNL